MPCQAMPCRARPRRAMSCCAIARSRAASARSRATMSSSSSMPEIELSPALDVVSVGRRDSDVDVKWATAAITALSLEVDNVTSESIFCEVVVNKHRPLRLITCKKLRMRIL